METPMQDRNADALLKFKAFIEGCSGRVKWASLNAVSHIRKSIEIADIDPMMAAFRAICAEEEAATALICSLKDQNYVGSSGLHFRHHAHKHAVIIFVSTVTLWFSNRKAQAGNTFGQHRVYFDDVKGRVGLHLALQLGNLDIQVQPTPPLHLVTQGPRTLADEFKDEMKVLLGLDKVSEIRTLIDQRANLRNTLLYATPEGIPKPKGDVMAFIENQAGIVNSLLTALALIDPWRKPDYPNSGVVTVSIEVFADLMKRVIKD